MAGSVKINSVVRLSSNTRNSLGNSPRLTTAEIGVCVCVCRAIGETVIEEDADQGIPHPSAPHSGGIPYCTALHDPGNPPLN